MIKKIEEFHPLLDISGSMREHDKNEDSRGFSIFEIEDNGNKILTGSIIRVSLEELIELNKKKLLTGHENKLPEFLSKNKKLIEDELELMRASKKYNL